MSICGRNIVGIAVAASFASLAHAGVELEHFIDQESWEEAVGDFATIDFTGFDNFQLLEGDEFTDYGVTLDAEWMRIFHTSGFVNDGEGLEIHPDGLWVTFDQDMQWLAADHPGTIQYALYRDGDLLAESDPFFTGGVGFFAGIWSPEPFDMAHIFRPTGDDIVFIDDLHFGPPIPVPSAIGVMAVGVLLLPRRRRRSGRTP